MMNIFSTRLVISMAPLPKLKKTVVSCFASLICLLNFGNGQIRLPRLISDGAVLQRDTELKLWGWASPREEVVLSFKNQTFTAHADQEGNWLILLPPQKSGGPHELKFNASNEIVLRNILFGEVWLCSGQSNMELTMERVKDTYPDEIARPLNTNIRQFLVPDKYDFKREHEDLDSGNWMESNPENIYQFSAVAYFFARELYKRFKVPIGLINAALGGSPAEAWMSETALKQFPGAYEEMQRFKDDELIKSIEAADNKRIGQWYGTLNSHDPGLVKDANWYRADLDHSDWEEMTIPGFWDDIGVGNWNGSVWFRRNIELPLRMTGKEAKLWLGRIVDRDSVYVNGVFVGTVGYQYPPRKYTIPAGLLHPGKNSIALRVINEQGKGGFIRDKPYFLAAGTDTIDLKGIWKYKLGYSMKPIGNSTFIRWKPGGLYNRMIAPLLNYQIRGVIWYQGESNTSNPKEYHEIFPALICDWRKAWASGDFPFLFVQLANFMEELEVPAESDWAELRQAQLNSLKLKNTGMAVSIDIGEWNDIHPLNKEDIGKRLANLARRIAYGEKASGVAVSPVPESCKFGKKKVMVRFKDVGTSLTTRNGQSLQGFELSADGVRFVKANAIISGSNVNISHPDIKKAIAVRYAWADNPANANLVSAQGLPVSPFEFRN